MKSTVQHNKYKSSCWNIVFKAILAIGMASMQACYAESLPLIQSTRSNNHFKIRHIRSDPLWNRNAITRNEENKNFSAYIKQSLTSSSTRDAFAISIGAGKTSHHFNFFVYSNNRSFSQQFY